MDCGNIVAMGVLTAVKGILIWGSTSLTDVPASLGLVSTLVVDNGGNEYISYEGTEFIEGESQVLEEDESGFLRAYHNVLTGVTSLLRGCHKNTLLQFIIPHLLAEQASQLFNPIAQQLQQSPRIPTSTNLKISKKLQPNCVNWIGVSEVTKTTRHHSETNVNLKLAISWPLHQQPHLCMSKRSYVAMKT